jgi:hypothetical protein
MFIVRACSEGMRDEIVFCVLKISTRRSAYWTPMNRKNVLSTWWWSGRSCRYRRVDDTAVKREHGRCYVGRRGNWNGRRVEDPMRYIYIQCTRHDARYIHTSYYVPAHSYWFWLGSWRLMAPLEPTYSIWNVTFSHSLSCLMSCHITRGSSGGGAKKYFYEKKRVEFHVSPIPGSSTLDCLWKSGFFRGERCETSSSNIFIRIPKAKYIVARNARNRTLHWKLQVASFSRSYFPWMNVNRNLIIWKSNYDVQANIKYEILQYYREKEIISRDFYSPLSLLLRNICMYVCSRPAPTFFDMTIIWNTELICYSHSNQSWKSSKI